ncbi:MAG: porin family protein [Elusimicrobia bacterium]|nr:porin family protein [Elusimicrobiota bacterium]
MKKLALLSLLLAVSSVSAYAEGNKKLNISLLTGMSMPTGGKWNDNGGTSRDLGYRNSFSTGFQADYELSDGLALGLEIGRDWKHMPHDTGNIESSDKCGNVDILRITPYARLFKKFDRLTIYEMMGIGLYEVDRSELSQSVWILPIEERYSSSKDYLGFNLGVGATYAVTSHLDLGLDLRWHHIFSNMEVFDASTGGSSFAQIPINNIVPSFKIQYAFEVL